jgi:hypothetical protein
MLSTMAGHRRVRRRELTVPGSADRPGQPPAPDQPDPTDGPGRLRSASPRPDLPATLDRADERSLAESGDHAGRWSKADLRQRLERLPPGHPSSLRSGDRESGQARDLSQPDNAESPGPEPDAVNRNYWGEIPGFRKAWADHVRRWPADRVASVVDRAGDPAGSWRGDGDQYLNPEQHAQANEVIADMGRSEKKLSEHMGETARDNAYGGWLEGLEYRLKGEERLKEKIAESLRIAPAKTPEEVIREVPDAIRYTFCFEPNNYTGGYTDVRERMELNGYRMVYSRNHWRDDPEYKGINTRWVTPEGQLFEVQFHTLESYHAKQEITHKSYERIRSQLTDRGERRELEAFQREVCSWIAVPSEAARIPDYEEKD